MIYKSVSGKDLPTTWTAFNNPGLGKKPCKKIWFLARQTLDGKREDYTKSDGVLIRFSTREAAIKKAMSL